MQKSGILHYLTIKITSLLTLSVILGLVAFMVTIKPYELGNLFFGKSNTLYNVDVAQFFFKQTVTRDHVPMFANYQLSRTYFIQGKFSKAIFYADKELELYPENCRTHYIRGLTYGYMENLDSAIADFQAFNKDCVKNSWAGHNDLAWFFFRKGDITNMLITIEEVIPVYPNNPWVQNTYGLALLNAKKYKEAYAAFKKAEEIANLMKERDWGIAYPGNNPKIYEQGLLNMRKTIRSNLEITRTKCEENKINCNI